MFPLARAACCLVCLLWLRPLEGSLLGREAESLGDATASEPLLLFPEIDMSICVSDLALTDTALADPSACDSVCEIC